MSRQAFLVSIAIAAAALRAAAALPPIIDMHLHAHTLADYGGGGPVCTNDEPVDFPSVDPRVAGVESPLYLPPAYSFVSL